MNKEGLSKPPLYEAIGIDKDILESKKEQTTKKNEYVKRYVENWLYVMTSRAETKSVTFIDAMSNAGIYLDGQLGTSAEVFKLFTRFAKKHSAINFRIYINDYDAKRVRACIKVFKYIEPKWCSNITVVWANLDVNAFLDEAASTNKIPKGHGNAIVLFVDPYNARTVHLAKLKEFIESRYCEVLFNWFSSDYRRNKGDAAILDCFDGLSFPEGVDATDIVCESLRTGNIKYVFSYAFRIATNAELYQIVFATPHPAGLKKLKAALWDTFHGEQFHKNSFASRNGQQSLFSPEDFEVMNEDRWSEEARNLLVEKFAGQQGVTYEAIEVYLLERSMLEDGQIISSVLRPLEKEGLIAKSKLGRAYKEMNYNFSSPLH